MLDGKFDEFREVGDAEFLHHAAAVGFHSFGGEINGFSNFCTGFAFHNHLQHFAFTLTEAFQRAFYLLHQYKQLPLELPEFFHDEGHLLLIVPLAQPLKPLM